MTRAVRARVRPPLPAPGRGERWLGLIRDRIAGRNQRRVAGAAMVMVALVVGLIAWRALAPARRSVGHSAAPSRSASGADPAIGAEWARVLVDLDAHRERAFATGDPSLLAGVYAPGSLLDQDTATMIHSVPAGCRVVGLRTTYAGVVALARTDAGATIRATATLAPAAVTCGSTISTHTPARPPTELTIELVTATDGYRIAGLRLE
jgi:hypothetical protein